MDFFEALKRKAADTLTEGEGSPVIEEWAGINATIESLKEMMVGGSIDGKIVHQTIWGNPYTTLAIKVWPTRELKYKMPKRELRYSLVFQGHQGTAGEGVYVMVFRRKHGQMERRRAE